MRKKPKKPEVTCADCHHHCVVQGKPACTYIPQKPNKPSYKFLKSMDICQDFWPIRRR